MFFALKDLLKLLTHFDKTSKIRVVLNLFLSLINSLLESISLSSSLVFFSILFNEKISEITFINKYLPFLIDIPKSKILVLFILVFTLTGAIRIYYLKNTFYLSRFISSQLSSLAFFKIINQDYEYHIEKNTSMQVSILTNDIGESVNSINALLQILSSTLSLLSIGVTIAFVIYGKSLMFIATIPLIYALLYLNYAKKYKVNSKLISDLNGKEIEFVKDSLFSIRNILLSHNQKYYYQSFKKIDGQLKEAQALNNFYSIYPRNAIEVLVVASLASLFVIYPTLASPTYIPIFAALIFAIQRIFPLFQSIYNGFSAIQSFEAGVLKLNKLLSLKLPNYQLSGNKKLTFQNISFSNVSYTYPNSGKDVLSNISLELNAGDRIGIYGPSGSGKSTFINLLMSLLAPGKGLIKVNKRILDSQKKTIFFSKYQNSISHIPQSIHLIDEDILTNIVGPNSSYIDEKKLKLALKVSCLDDFILSLPKKLKSKVGENGSFLSGGQKQRIGIAREIYKMKPILVLDEATNALDPHIENIIINRLFKLKYLKLIVIVSHKKSNLLFCNKICKIHQGKIFIEN